MFSLLFTFTLCSTIVGIKCDLTPDTTSVVYVGFAFEMIMTKLQFLQDRFTEVEEQVVKKISDLSSTMENIMQQENHPYDVYGNAYRSCAEVAWSGIYNIQPDKTFKKPISVLCDQEYESGGWIVIQHRFNGSTNFIRNWNDYKKGFGNLDEEFWLGLERIYQLTASRPHELVVLIQDFEGNKTYAKYSNFEIGDEREKYIMRNLGRYSGTAGNFLEYFKDMTFSTFDEDNRMVDSNCTILYTGGWWINDCSSSTINGLYLRDSRFQTSKMMIRPKKD